MIIDLQNDFLNTFFEIRVQPLLVFPQLLGLAQGGGGLGALCGVVHRAKKTSTTLAFCPEMLGLVQGGGRMSEETIAFLLQSGHQRAPKHLPAQVG